MEPDVAQLAQQINSEARAGGYDIAQLQEIRKDLKNLSRRPTRDIFGSATVFVEENYAFHTGGREELQYNIGVDSSSDPARVRHGVAFSLQRSRNFLDIEVLFPKIDRFNAFLRLHDAEFTDMRMRHHLKSRSEPYMPSPISPELLQRGAFIFFGKTYPIQELDVESILTDFDRLLPLYEYVEQEDRDPTDFPDLSIRDGEFSFHPGHRPRKRTTVASPTQESIDVHLRHGRLQDKLVDQLQDEHGVDAVGSEIPNGVGGNIDVVVEHDTGYYFFEIKNERPARACLRMAIAQLLEYSYWPGATRAERLVVVGEPALDHDAKEYLARLQEHFNLPLGYRQVRIEEG